MSDWAEEHRAGAVGWRLVLLAILAVGVSMVVPLPERDRGTAAVTNLAHAPVFGLLAWLTWRGLRARWSARPARALAASWLLAVAFGGLMELIQGLAGRDPSVEDIVADAIGATAFLAFGLAAGRPGVARFALVLGGLGLLAVPSAPHVRTLLDLVTQRFEVPRLASFETDPELGRWEFTRADVRRVRDHASDGRWNLRVALLPGGAFRRDPVLAVAGLVGIRALEFDATLDPGEPVPLVIGIEDRFPGRRAEDRFQRTVVLRPGANTVRLDLDDVRRTPSGRRMNLGRMRRMQLVVFDLPRPRTLDLDAFRLADRVGPGERAGDSPAMTRP